jgi:uncharacterized protein GlcG (DUF336 family)
MNATPLPVSIALAGHMSTRCLRIAIATSSSAQVATDRRICAIETRKWNSTWPSTCSVVITTARCSRGSLSFGSTTGYALPRIESVRPPGAGAACALMPLMVDAVHKSYDYARMLGMKLDRARAIVDFIVSEASGPVSVFVAVTHGELVAAATMDGAAPDTRLNAQRKAYTAARSDARTTRQLAEKVENDAVERASFDPFFTFFLGGIAVFDGDVRIGAVGVSGLPGEADEQLALAAIEQSADR